MSERMNPARQMQQQIIDSLDPNQLLEEEDKSKMFSEYRRAYGKVNFSRLGDVFSDLENKLKINFREGRSPASVEFFYDSERPVEGLYRNGLIRVNVAKLEAGLTNVKRKYPGYSADVLREFAIVSTYAHEIIHHYTNNLTTNKTVGFEIRIGDERYFTALNEAVTELLSQYIFYKYVGDRFPMEGRENNISYFGFAAVVRELLYLSLEVEEQPLSGQTIEHAWFKVVQDFVDPSKRFEDNFMYKTIKSLGPQFVLDFINLGSNGLDEIEEDMVINSLLRIIGTYRMSNGLSELAFPMAA